MSTFIVLAKKEVAQMIREFKIIWLPLVFIFLGITQPVVTYYLPDILKAVGGGQGITIDPSMAAQNGGEVLASTLGSQFDQLGVMIIIVSIMGIIQSDKANGMLAFILTRPVKVSSYIYGKIISNYLFVTFSVTIGYLVSYLYVYLLFTSIHFIDFLAALLFYLLWVLFIVSFTTMISTIFNSQGIIALISIVFLLVCRVIVGLSPVIDKINPASMSKYGMDILVLGTVNTDVIWGGISTILLSALTIMAANKWISKKKYSNE
ncbi:ABC transporter permease subunit [Neobacillus mesonae]|uniref:ABC transporter permease subunit n=1 Tax=Neobacillus mesonae TaxID=1193713 RepID=UPI002E1A722C|nr:ABC transporter permease subunit [Neobacillus mesonae]MED4205707.1 ABC transporter permease subunit [Neobacillus mesonae]